MNKIRFFFISLWVALTWEWYNQRIDNPIRDFFERRRLKKEMKNEK
jgi:hypothetical protein